MRLGKSARLWVGLIAMAVTGSCGDRDVEAINIDGHVFEVPRAHLIEERIPWLPKSKEKGLMFIINPKDPVRQRISVLIESTSITCRSTTPPVHGQLASVCEATKREAGNINQPQNAILEKELLNGDPTQWVYRLVDKRGEGQGEVVATCSAMGDGNGLCHSLGNYGDLVYNIGLRDSEIQRLPAIQKKVYELLSSWEKPTH